MAASKKRSHSDMRRSNRFLQYQIDDDTYRMMVLRFEEPEEDVDRHFLQTALELGINVPHNPKTTLELVTKDVSVLSIDPNSSEPSLQPTSRTSLSTHGASDSSIEQRRHLQTPSLTATSVTSAPSTTSEISAKFDYGKIKKGFWRLSAMRRRKTLALPVTVSSNLSPTNSLIPGLQTRPTSAERIQTKSPRPHAPTTDDRHRGASPHWRTTSLPNNIRPPLSPASAFPAGPTSPPKVEQPIESFHDTSESLLAHQRSLHNATLKRLRTSQLQEQLRFISFFASQSRLIHNAHLKAKRDAIATYKASKAHAESRHSEALISLEHRHLSAELDQRKALESERKACETRLKHMQAYCDPRNTVEGMPKRIVTRNDYNKLEQQYHVRNGMDNLHASRINVLRETQAKQLERILAKQDTEIQQLQSEFEQQDHILDEGLQAEERRLRREFSDRKKRLVRRWDLTEAIERKKLEIEEGDKFGALPVVEWSEDKGGDATKWSKDIEHDMMKR